MPNYTYQCGECDKQIDRTCSIADMIEYEKCSHRCEHCGGIMFRKLQMQSRPIHFREGWYEHVTEHPVYISNANQLADVCERAGNTSQYLQDMGGLLGVKRRRG